MRLYLTLLLTALFFGIIGQPVEAHAKKSVHKSAAAKPQSNPRYAAFVVDGDTGKILFQEDADKLRYPASLTKMMTLYLLFEAMEKGKVDWNTRLAVSAEAAGRPATNMFLSPGDVITVRDAVPALIIRSANDVAVVVAENLAGSEENFARIMTERARQLGMKNTTFRNASGLHNPKQITTAKDMALLGIALKKHYPQYFSNFAKNSFEFRGKTYTGHNRVTQNYPGADGLKTGFVNASGFNLVTTASRRGINLVGVVLGGATYASRDNQMMKLLDQGFEKASALKNRGYVSEYPNTNRERPDTYQTAYKAEEEVPEAALDTATGEGDESDTTPAPLPAVAAAPIKTKAVKAKTSDATLPATYEPSTAVRKLASPTVKSSKKKVLPTRSLAKSGKKVTTVSKAKKSTKVKKAAAVPTPKAKPKITS